MKKTFFSIMIIIGTVLGSGFASGKEIAVFFSRFGTISYFFILIAFFLFFGVIFLFLSMGEKLSKKISSSKIFAFLTLIVSLIFTSSMFAGEMNVLPQNLFVKIAAASLMLLMCFVVIKKGMGSLEKFNSILIPFTLLSLLMVLCLNFSVPNFIKSQNVYAGVFFTFLYVVLNFSISSIVIAKSGAQLTKKQKVFASFFSSLTLSVFLLLSNFVLLSHPAAMQESMPLLAISSGMGLVLIKFVIFSGCITTLFSLVYTSADCLKKFKFNFFGTCFVALILPFCFSFLGFGVIVSYLYPFASVLGTIFLCVAIVMPEKRSP